MNKTTFSLAMLGALAFAFSTTARTDQNNKRSSRSPWQVSVTVGAALAPKFLGDNDYSLRAFPNVSVKYKDLFFASAQGAGFNLINQGGLRVGPIVRYNFGRDEDGKSPLSLGEDTRDLEGLGDVDATVEVGFFLEYSFGRFTNKVEVRQGLGGHEGLLGEVELKYSDTFRAFDRSVVYSIGPRLSFADDSYNDAFFSVNAAQARKSGLTPFQAGGGTNSIGLRGSVALPVTRNTSVIAFGGYTQLTGDIADSSLVRERGSEHQGIAGLLVNYKF